jgi:hypothetical protein
MAPRLADLLSLSNKEISFSKELAYQSCAAPGGSLTSVRIELYTFMKGDDNFLTVSSSALFILLYYFSSFKGSFLSPHLEMNDVSNVVKLGMFSS